MLFEDFKGTDIYLLDQIFKGRLTKDDLVLDAGCGSGRNLIPLFLNGFNIYGIDPNETVINEIVRRHPNLSEKLMVNTIEGYSNSKTYDFIICNAVLHFAESHLQFHNMFTQLVASLNSGGTLFIRMTSNIGLEGLPNNGQGIYQLPDGTSRYLLTRTKVDELLEYHNLKLLEPVKTVFVDGLRSMTTLVLNK